MIQREAWYREANERQMAELRARLARDPVNRGLLEQLFFLMQRSGQNMNYGLDKFVPKPIGAYLDEVEGIWYHFWSLDGSGELDQETVGNPSKMREWIRNGAILEVVQEFLKLADLAGWSSREALSVLLAAKSLSRYGRSRDAKDLAHAVDDAYPQARKVYDWYSRLYGELRDRYEGPLREMTNPETGEVTRVRGSTP
jgi:hypothetical protein